MSDEIQKLLQKEVIYPCMREEEDLEKGLFLQNDS